MNYKVEDILDFLIGHTDICCETNYDEESYKNIDKLDYIITNLIDRLTDNYCYGKNRYEASARNIYKKSSDIMFNIYLNLKDYFDDIENEDK